MSVDQIVRSIVVNVGDIDASDSRIRFLFTHPVSGMSVYGLEFPIHKPNRSLKIAGREHVGRDQDNPAFFPTCLPLTTGQDTQTEEGCAVSAVEDLAPDTGGNYVQLAFIAYDPAAPTVGLCVAYLNITTADSIAAARFSDMTVVEENKHVPRQSNITLVVLPGDAGNSPGTSGLAGLCATGLTGQLEYEIFV